MTLLAEEARTLAEKYEQRDSGGVVNRVGGRLSEVLISHAANKMC